MAFVLDASIAVAWFLPDERNDPADAVLDSLRANGARAPTLFWFEARDLFLMAERRGRFRPGEALLSVVQLRGLPIEDAGTASDIWSSSWRASTACRAMTRATSPSPSMRVCRSQPPTVGWPKRFEAKGCLR